MIEFPCQHCKRPVRYRDSYAGKQGRCPSCGGKVTVPRDPDDELSAVAEALRSEECTIIYMWGHDAEDLPGVKTIRLLWQDI